MVVIKPIRYTTCQVYHSKSVPSAFCTSVTGTVLTTNTITSLYSTKGFVFVTERRSVYCYVRTEAFDIILVNLSSSKRQT